MDEAGHTSFVRYRLAGKQLYIDHVESPPALRGSGAAGRLMSAVAQDARAQGFKVTPVCGYAARWFRRNPHPDLTP